MGLELSHIHWEPFQTSLTETSKSTRSVRRWIGRILWRDIPWGDTALASYMQSAGGLIVTPTAVAPLFFAGGALTYAEGDEIVGSFQADIRFGPGDTCYSVLKRHNSILEKLHTLVALGNAAATKALVAEHRHRYTFCPECPQDVYGTRCDAILSKSWEAATFSTVKW